MEKECKVLWKRRPKKETQKIGDPKLYFTEISYGIHGNYKFV